MRPSIKRRSFLKQVTTLPALATTSLFANANPTHPGGSKPTAFQPGRSLPKERYSPGHITNTFNLYLPGEKEALRASPRVMKITASEVFTSANGKNATLRVGSSIEGWRLVALLPWLNGIATAVFEKHVTHRGCIAYVTQEGEIASIPKQIGDLAQINPRPISDPHGLKFDRPSRYTPGPDLWGEYILNSDEDPCYENVAALGAELIGWTLVANEETGPEKSLWLEADGKSRQFGTNPQALWAPDLTGRLFDPRGLLPSEYLYEYVPGYSKRTLIGGFLPAADIGVWNPKYRLGYEVMVILPPGLEAHPLGRVRALLPSEQQGTLIPEGDTGAGSAPSDAQLIDRYWNGSGEDFFSALVGIWNHWQHFFADRMQVEIPDEWLLDAARAGITLSRCSYRGLEPTYQIGEGAYTKIPERSHALFPVAHYEFVWAHQIWNLTREVEPYFQHYLEKYILVDGNFVYNTQDQVEAPLNCGVFLENSARAYDYTHDLEALRKRLPVLRRMLEFVLERYRYSERTFGPDDPRHGLIWGSPEADNGDPNNDFPDSHPYYYQNASWTWRGLHEHARCLERAGSEHQDPDLRREAAEVAALAAQIRAHVERSLKTTLEARNPEMKRAGITPFSPFDTTRKPTELTSYENHRYMMDWWTSDWGDPELDAGHFRHRALAGQQIMGMNIDGDFSRTSNFMEHGTLAGRIRQEDYRPFLLALYGNLSYAMDTGNRYAPEDALLPGNFPGEGSPYAWSAVVNSELQPTLGLRWLLCYEEHDHAVVHLQRAAPRHWFKPGERIYVEGCPTRFGQISWTTESLAEGGGKPRWRSRIEFSGAFKADLVVHIHPPDRQPIKSVSLGELHPDRIVLHAALLSDKTKVDLEIS